MIDEQREHSQKNLLWDLAAEGVEKLNGVGLQQRHLRVGIRPERGKDVSLKELAHIDQGVGSGRSLLWFQPKKKQTK